MPTLHDAYRREKRRKNMVKFWDYVQTAVSYAIASPIYFYEYVKDYPGQVVILWPISVVLAVMFL
jgi:hypothetical protein